LLSPVQDPTGLPGPERKGSRIAHGQGLGC
jgi:hypothetical protein